MSADENADSGVETVHSRLDAMWKKMERLEEENRELREQQEEDRAEIRRLERRLEEQQKDLAELDGRTDLLQLVEAADTATGKQRSVALLRHCQRKLDASGDAHRLRLDRDDAEDALHHPAVDRTTIYDDMRRAADLVGDESVASYSNGELRVDLSEDSLDATIQQHASGGQR